MRLILQMIFLLCSIVVIGQSPLNMELLSHITFNEDGNDIWGFVDSSGTEYAVMGTQTATRIYSLEDLSNPIERYVASGASSIWRDIKYFNNHLYVTTDQGSDGLVIIDVSGAPDTFSHTFWKPELAVEGGNPSLLKTAHNLYIDENGYAYLAGSNIGNRGILILDLNVDPKEPVLVGNANTFYSHDAYVKDNLLYSSELAHGFAIYDVSDKSNVVELARQNTSTNFCHNTWLSEDGNYLYTTDEKGNAFLDVYDIRDKTSIQFKDKFQPLETTGRGVIPHNTHTLGNYAVTSWYTDGVVITDMTRPENVILVGHYDTYNGPDGGFSGDWGAYPYLPSGTMLVSDINSGLYVLGAEFKRACYLEGRAESKDENGNISPIEGASIKIIANQFASDNTNAEGIYKTGIVTPGDYKVVFSHPTYGIDTFDVILANGDVTILNFLFEVRSITGRLIDAVTGEGIQGKLQVSDQISGNAREIAVSQDGTFSFGARDDANYDIIATSWGFQAQVISGINLANDAPTIALARGYEDDFVTDLGWTVSSTAPTGKWTRVTPLGTKFNDDFCNPNVDVADDLGNKAYVTGNSGVGAGDDDIDDGSTTLTSPIFNFEGMDSMVMTCQLWFYNNGGNSTPNDTLIVSLNNGIKSFILDKVTTSGSVWIPKTYHVNSDQLTLTENMTIQVKASDYDPGHLVEAGFDQITINAFQTTAVDQGEIVAAISATPTISTGSIQLKSENDIESISIINVQGRVISKLTHPGHHLDISKLSNGIYFLTIESGNITQTIKIVKI